VRKPKSLAILAIRQGKLRQNNHFPPPVSLSGKNQEKRPGFSRPGLFPFQDPRIRFDSAQRCFKKATEKSADLQISGVAADERAQRCPERDLNCD
jgi:hypothetical protein